MSKDKKDSSGTNEVDYASSLEWNGQRVDSYDYTQLLHELQSVVKVPNGTFIDQHLLYIDTPSSMDWLSYCSRADYVKSVSKYDVANLDWAASMVHRYLADSKFSKNEISFLSLGPGSGKDEEVLLRCLLDNPHLRKINCTLLDISPHFAVESHKNICKAFAHRPEVQASFTMADFMKLSHYHKLFRKKENKDTLQLICMLGGTFGNINQELHFVRQLYRFMKKGDLFLVHVFLGYASAQEHDAIRAQEPVFSHLHSSGGTALESWLCGPIKRYRTDAKIPRFDYQVLRNPTSNFPDAYTIEAKAILDDDVSFTILEMHRYEMDNFFATFKREGFRLVSGQKYGYNKKRLACIFAKE